MIIQVQDELHNEQFECHGKDIAHRVYGVFLEIGAGSRIMAAFNAI